MSEPYPLAALVDRLNEARVLCVGDVMLDRFVRGTVDRVSPEAPIPVLRVDPEHSDTMLGGVGNVAHNVTSLGARAVLISAVGQDAVGSELMAAARAVPGLTLEIIPVPGRTTTLKERYAARGQQLLRVDRETTAEIGEAAATAVLAAVERHLGQCGAVVVSDYGKGVLTERVLRCILDHAESAGCPVIIDPYGLDYGRYRGAAVISPNRAELQLASGLPCQREAEIIAAARSVMRRWALPCLLVTRSEDGMSLITTDQATHFSAQAREVYDVSGAGDTVVATFAVARALAAAPPLAAALANTAAGIVVQKLGTAVVYPEDILATLHETHLRLSDAKVKPLAAAARIVDGWRRAGQRIGFTNGTFDLLHPGHLSSIRQARSACDRLVLGLNSDSSVRRYKGPTRPIQGETARALVLASIEQVDLVVIFDDDTPMAVIQALRPDVLVKGADYRLDQVVGAEFVASYGGKVILADLVDGQSTTRTIARMVKKP